MFGGDVRATYRLFFQFTHESNRQFNCLSLVSRWIFVCRSLVASTVLQICNTLFSYYLFRSIDFGRDYGTVNSHLNDLQSTRHFFSVPLNPRVNLYCEILLIPST